MGDDVLRWLVEARVEQELSKPTVFSIRFEDDLCEGEPAVARRAELQSNAVIGIFVKAHDAFECLVHGPITRVRTASMMGGPGSWVEIRGEDVTGYLGIVKAGSTPATNPSATPTAPAARRASGCSRARRCCGPSATGGARER